MGTVPLNIILLVFVFGSL